MTSLGISIGDFGGKVYNISNFQLLSKESLRKVEQDYYMTKKHACRYFSIFLYEGSQLSAFENWLSERHMTVNDTFGFDVCFKFNEFLRLKYVSMYLKQKIWSMFGNLM